MECPKKYCFHWIEKGTKRVPFVMENKEVALSLIEKTRPAEVGYCGSLFGDCVRTTKNDKHQDWFEPCEPALKRDGFSMDYFD